MKTLQLAKTAKPVRLAIIDDCRITVELFKDQCEMDNVPVSFCNIAPVLTFEEACALIHRTEPDIVALDLFLTDGQVGDKIAAFIATYYPKTRIVVISGSSQLNLHEIFGQYTDLIPGKVAEDFSKCISSILESRTIH